VEREPEVADDIDNLKISLRYGVDSVDFDYT
jgi:hypothetical protein